MPGINRSRSPDFCQRAQWRIALIACGVLISAFAVLAGVRTAEAAAPTRIDGALGADGQPSQQGQKPSIGLNGDLTVMLNGDELIDPSKYFLYLAGAKLEGLPARFDVAHHAVVFTLKRNDQNRESWVKILGSPTGFAKDVPMSLEEVAKDASGKETRRQLLDANGMEIELSLKIAGGGSLGAGVVLVALVLVLVWGTARRTAILRDTATPMLALSDRPYSLGRWQMAFWFTLVLSAFVFLWVLTGDYDTITADAVTLMGISAATALGAVAMDNMKTESPWTKLETDLKAAGFASYSDVIAQNTPKAYVDAIEPYKSRGLWKDLMTDASGAALHRMQVFFWTIALGVVFVLGVYQNLAMPTFSATLLALMGISSGTYVGFKFPEKQ